VPGAAELDPGATRGDRLDVLIVEDQLSHAVATISTIERLKAATGRDVTVVAAVEHGDVIAHPDRFAADVALVDAMRHPNRRLSDPAGLPFAGLDVAQALHEQHPRCRVVGYSTDAGRPAVNIAFREVPSVAAVYDQAALVQHLDEVLWGDPVHQVDLPDAGTYAQLGVTPDARLWEAVRFARQRPDTWEAVARVHGYLAIPKRTRAHLNKYLPELVPMPGATTYRAYLEVLREVAGFA
jgi:hypothetical protein